MSSSRLAETARPPSEYTAVAENVRLVPLAILAAEVDVAIDVSLGADEPRGPGAASQKWQNTSYPNQQWARHFFATGL
jgi:hypothetical protein